MDNRKRRNEKLLFRERLPEDRFEDYTNVTPWEKFITDLQIILLDWLKSAKTPRTESGPISLIRTAIASFDSFEFRVENFITCPFSKKKLDYEISRVLVVASTYDLKEFILISPADPDARRLVGTTRIRLLLSSIEMALAASKCELPVLVSYGNDKLYHGLRLYRAELTNSPLSFDNLVPDSGLKKIEYSMGPSELPHAETHLAKLRDIFLEKVGTCKNLDISVLQYFRLVNLSFTGKSFSHLDNPVEFVYSPERLLSQILLHLQLNLFADSTNLHSKVINNDPEFRLVKSSQSDWFADCVMSGANYSLIDDVWESLTKALASNSVKTPKNLDSFIRSILDGELTAIFSQEPSASLSIPKAFMTQEFDDEALPDVPQCHYTGASIRVLLVALHIITLRLSSSAFSEVVFGSWITFLKYLERAPEAELLTIHPVDDGTVPFSDSPIDQTLFLISQHHSALTFTSRESTKSSEDEFFDAVEEQDFHHSGSTPQSCQICRRAFEDLEAISISAIANWIAPYLLVHHISLFQHFVVPPAITTWYTSRLRDLRKQISDHLSDYQTLFQLIKDFHRRSLCAVSLHTFFKFCGTGKELGPVVQELSDHLHEWSTYQVTKSLQIDHFNISRQMALSLDPQTRSIMAKSLTSPFNNSSQEATIIPISLPIDSTGQSESELTIQGASEQSFPAYRLVSISARYGARRPNPTLSAPTPQRLFACIRYPPTNGEEDPTTVLDKLQFIRNGQTETLDFKTPYKERDSSCQILFAGCFGEDCDIR
nr:rab3 GTPase activating protein catalytic subunit [Hymenolepis microstoma]